MTRAGCNSWCVNNGNICYGCRGLVSNPNEKGMLQVLTAHGAGLSQKRAAEKTQMYNRPRPEATLMTADSVQNLGVKVEYLTRVEGHGNIVVEVKDGALEACRFDVVESPRFFEALLRGRSIFEAQHITSRICGICACAHSLTSIQAAEEALGVVLPRADDRAAPLLARPGVHRLARAARLPARAARPRRRASFLPLVASHEKVVRRALRMKKAVQPALRRRSSAAARAPDLGDRRRLHEDPLRQRSSSRCTSR